MVTSFDRSGIQVQAGVKSILSHFDSLIYKIMVQSNLL